MPLSFGICAFSEQVDAEIESVVAVAIAQLSAPAPPARHLPPAPETSPGDAAAATLVERCTQPGRACIAQTRERIQATLEWESCDEEYSEDASDESASGSGSEDDDAYESSFVTDGSGSEDECDEVEWTPRKQ